MTAFSREVKLERLFRDHQIRYSILRTGLTPLDLAGTFGFIFFILSCFVTFTPVSESNWLQGPMGSAPLLFAFVGIVALYKKNYFAAFFIAMFNTFFLTHEIIILYDSKAVQMGRELGADGWFRPVLMVYSDALQSGYGALWGIIGSVVAVLAIMIAWVYENHRFNAFTAENATDDAAAYDSFFEDGENDEVLELDSEEETYDSADEESETTAEPVSSGKEAYSGASKIDDEQIATGSQDDDLVSEAEVSLVSILPAANTSVEPGFQLQFSPEARDDAGRLISSDPADFVWVNADEKGIFTRTTKGNYAVSAAYRGKKSNSTIVSVE